MFASCRKQQVIVPTQEELKEVTEISEPETEPVLEVSSEEIQAYIKEQNAAIEKRWDEIGEIPDITLEELVGKWLQITSDDGIASGEEDFEITKEGEIYSAVLQYQGWILPGIIQQEDGVLYFIENSGARYSINTLKPFPEDFSYRAISLNLDYITIGHYQREDIIQKWFAKN
jgi:hypothetical protein